MPSVRAKVIIVDDEPSIRTSMSMILNETGYDAQSFEDGFAALAALRQELPDIVVSDINMPGMSGLELLSVVRHRFPGIHTIAMSGVLFEDEEPLRTAADAFYQKGSGVKSLLKLLDSVPEPERPSPKQPSEPPPIWIQRNEHSASGEAAITIACPECLRTFLQPVNDSICKILETCCIHCKALIRYGIVERFGMGAPGG